MGVAIDALVESQQLLVSSDLSARRTLLLLVESSLLHWISTIHDRVKLRTYSQP